MDAIRKVVIDKVVKQLEALQAKYAFVIGDETFSNGLEVSSSKKRRNYAPRRDMSQFGIADKVKVMKIGDVITINAAAPFTATDIASNLSSRGIAAYGNGNFTVCVRGDEAQGMRLS